VADSLRVLPCRNRHSVYQNNEFKTPYFNRPAIGEHGAGDARGVLF
jgi:hypothetical protein